MPDLQETIRRLSASFADEIIAALRNVPLNELLALSSERDGDVAPEVAAKAEAKPATDRPRARRTRARTSTARGAEQSTLARPSREPRQEPSQAPAAATIDAAERVFVERGSRGATAVQLSDALAAQGVPPPQVADVIRVLVEREVIRDAGFRRTTGQGTAPVFVSCRGDLRPAKTATDLGVVV